MPSLPSPTDDPNKRTRLLHDVVELLTAELATIAHRQWEDLPDLKKKKVVLACRFREFDWMPGATGREPVDELPLKSLIADLEDRSRQKIENQLEFIDNHILALQEQHQYLLESLNVSFRKFYDLVPSA
ncbi:MAG TPA: hypothetical protein VGZ93_02240 [Candidatus Methylacidiphilales bacterium]|jgi:hypothetical protein|nr:hypothetical protein [Candidatus Methylacidiphilales bacterium]